MEQTFHTDILPSGMRIVCAPGHSDVVYCGVAIDAGTRDEGVHENGIAHYTEHLSFKGTRQRNAWRIINRMESVGGELNAFTGKEETVYYCTCMKEHFARAVDVLLAKIEKPDKSVGRIPVSGDIVYKSSVRSLNK